MIKILRYGAKATVNTLLKPPRPSGTRIAAPIQQMAETKEETMELIFANFSFMDATSLQNIIIIN
ncbi:hypothetical protein L1765_03415 [Microaerobacter geothermalis]|uniref:hypothetical protein n=1 Tax=Microaerobacter geothermalis TaxID=674972 RepID=UPI001F447CA6|nr:hypothetical protein [Microaerobacter geothermalis]